MLRKDSFPNRSRCVAAHLELTQHSFPSSALPEHSPSSVSLSLVVLENRTKPNEQIRGSASTRSPRRERAFTEPECFPPPATRAPSFLGKFHLAAAFTPRGFVASSFTRHRFHDALQVARCSRSRGHRAPTYEERTSFLPRLSA